MSLLTSVCRQFDGLALTALRGIKQHGSGFQTVGSSIFSPSNTLLTRCMASIESMIRNGPPQKIRKPKTPQLGGCPQKKGVVLKVLIKKPKKPNSANRKCVRVRLTNGVEATAYVPGEGHNLQEHSIVLVEGSRCRDLPGVKLQCIRGKYDLAHVKK